MGLFLLKRILEQFKPYFIKILENGISTANQKVHFIFLTQKGFCKRLKQIFGSPKEELLVKKKLKII